MSNETIAILVIAFFLAMIADFLVRKFKKRKKKKPSG